MQRAQLRASRSVTRWRAYGSMVHRELCDSQIRNVVAFPLKCMLLRLLLEMPETDPRWRMMMATRRWRTMGRTMKTMSTQTTYANACPQQGSTVEKRSRRSFVAASQEAPPKLRLKLTLTLTAACERRSIFRAGPLLPLSLVRGFWGLARRSRFAGNGERGPGGGGPGISWSQAAWEPQAIGD
jgi:hypothetical protein